LNSLTHPTLTALETSQSALLGLSRSENPNISNIFI
jgi:hypothetical protein